MSAVLAYWHWWRLEVVGENALDRTLENDSAMDRFLTEVERKAFVIARISLRNEDDALDAVQDAMIRLVRKYAHRPTEEWKPLFYRILKNRIVDQQRKRTVQQRIMAWSPRNNDNFDPVATAPAPPGDQPQRQAEVNETMEQLQSAVNALPARQQQAFLLRTVESLDVAATAEAMGCSAGSVKTHYSRAVHSLRATLGDYLP